MQLIFRTGMSSERFAGRIFYSPASFKKLELLNPFLVNVPILYSLKTPAKKRFSDVFRCYKIGTLAKNVLISDVQKQISDCTLNPKKNTHTCTYCI